MEEKDHKISDQVTVPDEPDEQDASDALAQVQQKLSALEQELSKDGSAPLKEKEPVPDVSCTALQVVPVQGNAQKKDETPQEQADDTGSDAAAAQAQEQQENGGAHETMAPDLAGEPERAAESALDEPDDQVAKAPSEQMDEAQNAAQREQAPSEMLESAADQPASEQDKQASSAEQDLVVLDVSYADNALAAPLAARKESQSDTAPLASKEKSADSAAAHSAAPKEEAAEGGFVFAALSAPAPARTAAEKAGPKKVQKGREDPLSRVGSKSVGTQRSVRKSGAPSTPDQAPSRQGQSHARRGSAGHTALTALALVAALGVGWAARGFAQGASGGERLSPDAPTALSSAPLPSSSEMLSGAVTTGQVEDLKAGPSDPNLWSLMLANTQHPLPDGYAPPSLTDMDGEGRQLDSRVAQAFQDMVAAAEQDGCHLVLLSGYRSEERQKALYVQMLEEYRAQGYTESEAWDATKSLRNLPGTSEHQTGLAADIVSDDYWELDEGFADTDEGRWLFENAADYGFILRYPKDKTEITGTSFEPWHYRYVGVEDAQKIMDQGITLEEYLGQA